MPQLAGSIPIVGTSKRMPNAPISRYPIERCPITQVTQIFVYIKFDEKYFKNSLHFFLKFLHPKFQFYFIFKDLTILYDNIPCTHNEQRPDFGTLRVGLKCDSTQFHQLGELNP